VRAVPRSTLPASTASKSPPFRMSPLAAMPVPMWRALQGSAYRELKEQLDLPFRAANHISYQKVNCGQNWPFSERRAAWSCRFCFVQEAVLRHDETMA
jgi:hypothetical protein